MHCNRTINITNCLKSVIIHITKRTLIGKEICVHSSNAVRAGLAKARMAAGYQREPLARYHETNFTRGVCVCICSYSVWLRGRRSCRRLPVISDVVVVAVAVCRLQRRRVSLPTHSSVIVQSVNVQSAIVQSINIQSSIDQSCNVQSCNFSVPIPSGTKDGQCSRATECRTN